MFSFPKWPQFPSISLPATIQRRFLSFILKRTLGHLVKPGQLDPAQVDAQIGSGFVQVNDVELDHDAINVHLADLPLPFMLEAGSIGKVSARIPWPGLLTAPLSLSLSSLSLTFVHAPRASTSRHSRKDDLAESVASMAESFVHDELSNGESEALHQGLNITLSPRLHPPGSIDPFLSTEDLDSQSHLRGPDEEGDGADPSTQGVSLIATLIERILARFEFDVSDVTIRLVLPKKAEFTLRLGQITYSTETAVDPSAIPDKEADGGEVRIVRVSGVTILTRDIQPSSAPSSTPSRRRSASPYSSSSSSEENDEAMMMMSQSLASLPPIRSISPESSMYHSATSSVRSPSPETAPQIEEVESVEEKILSLGQGSDPLVFRLVTPRLIVPSMEPESNNGLKDTGSPSHPHVENKIRLTVTTGLVAIALNPIHTRSLLYLSSALTTSKSIDESSSVPQAPSANTLDVAFHVKCVTVLLLRSPSPILTSQLTANDTLHDFFLARYALSSFPRVPHFRAQFDGLDFSFTPHPSSEITSHNRHSRDSTLNTIPDTSKQFFKATLADLSMFAISTSTNRGWTVSPVLISDPNLATQYDYDTKYPSFDVVDWTKSRDASTSGKVNQWRIRSSQSKRKSADIPPSATRSSRMPHPPAVQARFESPTAEQAGLREVDVVPLHVFVDLGIIEGAIDFVTVLTTSPTSSTGSGNASRGHGLDMDETPPATPRAGGFTGWQQVNNEKERKRLEDLVMNDFAVNENIHSESARTTTNLAFRITFLRLEIRVPGPPTLSSSPRSGAVVLDFHDVHIAHQGETTSLERQTRHRGDQSSGAGPVVLGQLQYSRIVVAATLPGELNASTFLSINSQGTSSENSPAFGINALALVQSPSAITTVLPSICIRSNPIPSRRPSSNASAGVASSFSFDAHLPTVSVTLSKPVLDGLTFWADDIAQCLLADPERASASDISGRSRGPSMIGSRFFAKRTPSTESSESGNEAGKSELVVKVSIGEAQIRLLVPRKDEDFNMRPLEVRAIDIDLLAEIKPEGKDETVVTMGVMDLKLCDMSATGATSVILQLTIPRDIVVSSRSFIKIRYISVVDNDTAAKESRLKLSISGFTYFFTPDFAWIADVGLFAKAPDGAFESVIPSERTKISVKITDGSFHAMGPNDPGALVAYIGELDLSTDLVGDSQEIVVTMTVSKSNAFFIDDISTSTMLTETTISHSSVEYWKQLSYALLAEADDIAVLLRHTSESPKSTQIHVDNMKLKLHACADTLPAFGSFASSLASIFQGNDTKPPSTSSPTPLNPSRRQKRDVFASVDEHAFRRMPDLGPAPDMIHDHLPTNPDYLDASFGAAAGLRELRDEDLLDFEQPEFGQDPAAAAPGIEGIISNIGGETIRMLVSEGIQMVEGHFENIPQDAVDISSSFDDTNFAFRARNCDLIVSLYDGYDWVRTRRTIEQEVKAIRRRLVKIRQLLASGQTPDDSIEETSSILFNSVYIGLPQDPEELEPAALIAAIDEELNDGAASESASQSSWQSFKPRHQHGPQRLTRLRGRRLERSRSSQIDFSLSGIRVEIDTLQPKASLVSRTLVTVRDLEILDHIKTSTWKKFLTELRTDFRGNVRETASDMLRAELRIVHPVPNLPTEEGRFRAKILPIKLHVDQDALDFMKKFFGFENPGTPAPVDSQKTELYFQHVEVFPVDIKLDYKPKRVDYKALREGRTIELMNFFHFDGADITLRHITLSGITGWPRLFDTLNDLWTPDVKANQLADIISGVSPVRSLVNVGSGVADLVLLPIAQYKKDKRLVRGVQKGTTSFVKSTAMEAIKLGARLATGTQVILEQAESVLGAQGQFKDTVTAEALQSPQMGGNEDLEVADLISKYADQPQDVREGMQSAYRSLSRNFNSAAQTILAVPMEVYERSGNEGPVRAIVRAVPIAVLKPMIGASEAVSKTLFGLRNTMDPEVKYENEAKYKQR